MQRITITHTTTIDVPDYGTRLEIDQIRDLVKRTGSHFFDPDTMRWFRSKVDYSTYTGPDGWYFVTSEKHVSHTSYGSINEPRKYTVRRLSIAPKGDDLTLYELEGFQRYATLGQARTAAARAAKHGANICPDCQLRVSHNPRCEECEDRAKRIAARTA